MLSGISPFESWPNKKRVGTWMMIYELDDRNSQSNLAGWISNFPTSSHFCLRMPKQPSRWPRMCGKSISPSAHLRAETATPSVLGVGWNIQWCNMGVSKNRGTPKWMVKIMENPIKMDDLGVPLFSETSICYPFFLRDENRCHFWDFPFAASWFAL